MYDTYHQSDDVNQTKEIDMSTETIIVGTPTIGGDVVAIFSALSKMQSEMPSIKKTMENELFGSKYTPLPDLIEQTRETLEKHGFSVIQSMDDKAVITILAHKSGGFITSRTALLLGDSASMHALGGAITYARRYGYISILGLAPDGDDDGNLASLVPKRQDAIAVPQDRAALDKALEMLKSKTEKGPIEKGISLAKAMLPPDQYEEFVIAANAKLKELETEPA